MEPRYNEDLGTIKITLLYQGKKIYIYKELGPENLPCYKGFVISDLLTRFHCIIILTDLDHASNQHYAVFDISKMLFDIHAKSGSISSPCQLCVLWEYTDNQSASELVRRKPSDCIVVGTPTVPPPPPSDDTVWSLRTTSEHELFYSNRCWDGLTLWRLDLKKSWTLIICVVQWCSDGSINSQAYNSFEIYAVTIKISDWK